MRTLLAALVFFGCGAAQAQSILGTSGRFSISGYVEEDGRLGLPTGGAAFIERSRTIGALRADAKPLPNFRAVFDGRFLATVESHDETPRTPLRNDVDAMFLELDRPGGAPVRIRAGRQTIRWGSGLLFNPTSVLNPPDLEDPLRYGAPLGNEAARIEISGEFHVDAVLVPRFRPALLPPIDSRTALAMSGEPGAIAIANDPAWSIDITPAFEAPRDVAGAVRLSGRLPVGDVDAALLGYSGRTPIPLLRRADFSADFAAKTLAGTAIATYPRLQIWGLDLATQLELGRLGAAGVWAEAAWVEPRSFYREIYVNGAYTRTHELGDSYLRVATGLDHTTADGLYVNLQFVRGFPEEVGRSAQGDYLVAVLDRPIFRERFHVRAVGSFDLDDRSALAAPELSFSADSVTFAVGAYAGTGTAHSKFGGPASRDPVAYARARASF